MSHLYIDVSHWQGPKGQGAMTLTKWRQLAKCNVRAAFVKASQGTGHVDNGAAGNVARARKVGMEVGLYHFLDGSNPTRQADHFLRTARAANSGKDARGRQREGTLRDLALVVDVERNPGAGGNARGWHARTFLRRVRTKAPRNTLLVYAAEGYWRAIGNPDMRDEADGLWQARWDRSRGCKSPRPAKPPRAGFGGWNGRPAFWQFGRLRMGSWGLDGNLFYGSLARLRDLFQTVEAVKPPPEPAAPPDAAAWRLAYNAQVAKLRDAVVLVPATSEAELEANADAVLTLDALHIRAASADPQQED